MSFCFLHLQKLLGLTLTLLLSSCAMSSWAQCLTGNDSPAMMDPQSKTLMTEARLSFALDALRKASVIEAHDNLFFSPHSLHQALTLVYFGARSTTESSLKKALHIPEQLSKVDVQRSYGFEKSLAQAKESQVRIFPNVLLELISRQHCVITTRLHTGVRARSGI